MRVEDRRSMSAVQRNARHDADDDHVRCPHDDFGHPAFEYCPCADKQGRAGFATHP